MKNKKAQMELGVETIAAAVFGILGGFIALFVMKSAGLGFFWKLITFSATAVAGFVVSYAIFTK